MYRATTRGIEVQVTPRFLSERSSPENSYYFWAYTIEITNRGPTTVQLKTRHWRITDAHGKLQEVRGAGVVGETPTLEPGGSFEYTSGVPLPTPSGFRYVVRELSSDCITRPMMVFSDQRRLERERSTRTGWRAAFASQPMTLDDPSAYGTCRMERLPIELEPLP